MTAVRPDRILAEFARLHDAESDPALKVVRTALLVEDVFGLVLSDGQIGSEILGDAEMLRNLIDVPTTPR